MSQRSHAYDWKSGFAPSELMSSEPNRRTSAFGAYRSRWLSWLTLLAGAVMCVIAVLLS
jgi:hypothetical protein